MKFFALTFLLTYLDLPIYGKDFYFESKNSRVNVLELYTSEGCSSCPPADEWMSRLEKHPELWKSFVPIAFHVDYWDYLGWKDLFSKAKFSKRQRNLVKRWAKPAVYTPGFLLNGQEFRIKADKKLFQLTASAVNLKIKASRVNNQLQITGNIITRIPVKDLLFYSTLMAHNIKNEISAGENEGRLLQHDFAALEFEKMKRRGASYTVSFVIPKKYRQAKLSFAAWLQSTQGEYLQAIGGYLQ